MRNKGSEDDERNAGKDDMNDAMKTDSEDPDIMCGCGSVCHPSWIQWLSKPYIFLIHSTLLAIFVYMNAAYFGSILTTIERQFGLGSAESALLAQINDVVGAIMAIPLSYIAGKGNRPAWFTFSVVIMAIGDFMSALPHYLSPPLDPSSLALGIRTTSSSSQDLDNVLCKARGTFMTNDTTSTEEPITALPPVGTSAPINELTPCNDEAVGLKGVVWWLMAGQMVYGFGQSIFYPIILSYLDDILHRDRAKFASYNAVLWVFGSVGPLFGYLFGGYVLSFYVDFDRVTREKIPRDISLWDPRWIGAWWIGFLVVGVILIVLAVPIPFYPRNPYPNGVCDVDEKSLENRPKRSIKGFAADLRGLVSNPVVVFFTLFDAAGYAALSIYTTFVIKFLTVAMGLSVTFASFLNAAIFVPCTIIGIILSAVICHFISSIRQLCRIVVFFGILTLGLNAVVLLLGCENQRIAGIHEAYSPQYPYPESSSQLQAGSCNDECTCSDNIFQPVCGLDGVTYISPCLAGCQSKERNDTNYDDCLCIETSEDQNGMATPGFCEFQCSKVRIYLPIALFGILMILALAPFNITIVTVLRSSDGIDKTLLFGFTSFISKILGLFPTPIYLGAIINSTCVLWEYTSCGSRAACWLYDIVNLRYAFFGVIMMVEALSLVSAIGMYATSKTAVQKKDKKSNSANVVSMESNGIINAASVP